MNRQCSHSNSASAASTNIFSFRTEPRGRAIEIRSESTLKGYRRIIATPRPSWRSRKTTLTQQIAQLQFTPTRSNTGWIMLVSSTVRTRITKMSQPMSLPYAKSGRKQKNDRMNRKRRHLWFSGASTSWHKQTIDHR